MRGDIAGSARDLKSADVFSRPKDTAVFTPRIFLSKLVLIEWSTNFIFGVGPIGDHPDDRRGSPSANMLRAKGA